MKHKDGNPMKLEAVELQLLFLSPSVTGNQQQYFFPKKMNYFFIRRVKLTEEDDESSENISTEEGSDALLQKTLLTKPNSSEG